MEATLEAIKHYVLNPDQNGGHLRQLAEHMADSYRIADQSDNRRDPDAHRHYLDAAAEDIAGFANLNWDGAPLHEHAARMAEIMEGYAKIAGGCMQWGYAWRDIALPRMENEIRTRMRLARDMVITAKAEDEAMNHFFDDSKDFAYLHDVAGFIEELHWQRKHSFEFKAWLSDHPEHGLYPSLGKRHYAWGDREDRAVEEHLRRTAREGLMFYIEQGNIAHGDITIPTDPRIVLSDRIGVQMMEFGGVKDEHTWNESGWRVADRVETRFGTTEGRRLAKRARLGWKAIARERDA